MPTDEPPARPPGDHFKSVPDADLGSDSDLALEVGALLLDRARQVARKVEARIRRVVGEPAPTPSPAAGPDRGPRVLCVDDSPDAADTLVALLVVAGFEPRACYSGPAALSTLAEFRPDACLIDLAMPGMDGLEVARRVRAAGRPLPLVAVTAFGDEDARRDTAAAGFDLHLTKPVDPNELAVRVIDLIIARSAGGR